MRRVQEEGDGSLVGASARNCATDSDLRLDATVPDVSTCYVPPGTEGGMKDRLANLKKSPGRRTGRSARLQLKAERPSGNCKSTKRLRAAPWARRVASVC